MVLTVSPDPDKNFIITHTLWQSHIFTAELTHPPRLKSISTVVKDLRPHLLK